MKSTSKPKLIFISNIAAPYQVKFCYVLQEYYDAEFWFYEVASNKRPSWWDVSLGEKCSVLQGTFFRKSGKYFSPVLFRKLRKGKPKILVLGGFLIPSNILAYFWAKLNGVDVFIMSEALRKYDSSSGLWKLHSKGLRNFFIRMLFSACTGIIVTNNTALLQINKLKPFSGKTVLLEYPNDIDRYFQHEYRLPKPQCRLLFANRLIDTYNPLFALGVLEELQSRETGIIFSLKMNPEGDLRVECEKYVIENNIQNVTFIESITSWEQLSLEYGRADILILPAKFSNGNFTIIEAMASGMGIVISDNIVGIGKYIENGLNGFCLPLDTEKFCNAILEYATDGSHLYKSHADINRKIARKYTMGELAANYRLKLDAVRLRRGSVTT